MNHSYYTQHRPLQAAPLAKHSMGYGTESQGLSKRRRVNCMGPIMCLLIPWVMYIVLYAVLTFQIHYFYPWLCYAIVALALVVVFAFGFLAYTEIANIRKREAQGLHHDDPSWLSFLFVTCAAAWIAGVCSGHYNYHMNMSAQYDIIELNTYSDVDPSVTLGQQVMDSGRINFVEGTHLQLNMSMGFQNMDTYCVSPIVHGTGKQVTYDFWAVGTNCCSSGQSNFACGDFGNVHAQAGLRLMRDDLRPYFRLAVQQAEATYNIHANHPLFYYWMQDPTSDINKEQEEGTKNFFLGTGVFFVFMLFATVVKVMLVMKSANP